MANDDEPDELPDISEMVEVMREVIAAEDALMTIISDCTPPRGSFTENAKRLTAAMNAQRALLARIDTLLAQELPG